MRRGVTAIAVKTVFVHEFPPQVCAMAEQTGTALLLYDGVYLEDVIAAVKGVLGQSAAFEKRTGWRPALRASSSRALRARLAQRLLGAAPPPGAVHGVRPSRAGGRPARGLRLRPIGRPPAAGPRSASAACWCCCAPQGGRACRPPLCARRQWAQARPCRLPVRAAPWKKACAPRAMRRRRACLPRNMRPWACRPCARRRSRIGMCSAFAARGWVPCAAMTKKTPRPCMRRRCATRAATATPRWAAKRLFQHPNTVRYRHAEGESAFVRRGRGG